MAQIELDTDEQTLLLEAFKTTSDRGFRDRCQAILMLARGRKRTHIAQDLNVSGRTLRNWIQKYRQQGPEGLRTRWAGGAQSKIPEHLSQTIIDWVKKGPAGCGLQRANWTSQELADHLYRQEGLRVCRRTMLDFCHAHNIRPYRPTYRFLRADEEKQKQAQEELDQLKKKPKRVKSSF